MPGSSRVERRFHFESKYLVGVRLVMGHLVLSPLLYLIAETFVEDGRLSFQGFERAFGFSGIWGMVGNSLVFTVGSSVVPLVLGTALAYVTARTNVPFRPLLFATALMPLIIPGLLYTIGLILISGKVGILNQLSTEVLGRPLVNVFSMFGMIGVEGTHNMPLAFLFMSAAFRSMDPLA